MKARIRNWDPETLDDSWFAEHGQESDTDLRFIRGEGVLLPLSEIPFLFDVYPEPQSFVLFMGQLLGAAVSGEIDISEPLTGLPFASIQASPLDGEIEVTPEWIISESQVSKFARARGLGWTGDFVDRSGRPGSDAKPDEQHSTQDLLLRPSAATRTQNTLLSIIAALADQVGIDPAERGAAARIEEWTEHIGAPVREETVKKYLDMIPDALERRAK